MLRIFLVIEDVTQMNALKVVLSKLGCIVETQGVELGLKDRILGFRPEILITAGYGKKINPLTVTQKVRETGKEIKILLLLGKELSFTLNDLAVHKFDAFIESPVDPLKLITTLNQFNKGKNNIDLVEKYHKILASGISSNKNNKNQGNRKTYNDSDKEFSFNSKFNSSIDDAERIKTYEHLTEKLEINSESTISKLAVRLKMSELQKNWNRNQLDEIDEAKRGFVKQLFRKK